MIQPLFLATRVFSAARPLLSRFFLPALAKCPSTASPTKAKHVLTLERWQRSRDAAATIPLKSNSRLGSTTTCVGSCGPILLRSTLFSPK